MYAIKSSFLLCHLTKVSKDFVTKFLNYFTEKSIKRSDCVCSEVCKTCYGGIFVGALRKIFPSVKNVFGRNCFKYSTRYVRLFNFK